MTTSSPRPVTTTPASRGSRGRGLEALRERHSGIPGLIGRRLLQIPLVLFVVSILIYWLL